MTPGMFHDIKTPARILVLCSVAWVFVYGLLVFTAILIGG